MENLKYNLCKDGENRKFKRGIKTAKMASLGISVEKELLQLAEKVERKAVHFKKQGNFKLARLGMDLAIYLREMAMKSVTVTRNMGRPQERTNSDASLAKQRPSQQIEH